MGLGIRVLGLGFGEVLAIVVRSGKYLPVGLTLGPVNGRDDFNFVADPGKSQEAQTHQGVDRLCG